MTGLSFDGKCAYVSAGASGIGIAIAQRLQGAGAEVLVSDIREEALVEAAELGLHTIQIDAASEAGADAVRERIRADFGRLDVLVNNAGIAGPTASISDTDWGDWQTTMRVNVDSQFLHIRALTELLANSGRASIVNLSSAAGLRSFPGRAAYAASKWAVVGLTLTAAAELGSRGIRVNAVCPGMIEGPRLDGVIEAKAAAGGVSTEVMRERFLQQSALGVPSSADDVAGTVLFLASDLARTVSGQVLSVDGFIEKMA